MLLRQVLLALIASISLVHCEPPLSNQYGVPGNFAGGSHHGGAQGGGNGFGGHYDGQHDSQDYIDNEVFVVRTRAHTHALETEQPSEQSRTHDRGQCVSQLVLYSVCYATVGQKYGEINKTLLGRFVPVNVF